MNKKWTLADMPRLDGKLALVTGANRGLGLEISAALAAAGARVVMACRDSEKAAAGVAEVQRRVPNALVIPMKLDLACLKSIREFADEFGRKFSSLDILVNNASAILVPLQKTRDGFEMHMGTNHFGPFALTGLLLDLLRNSPGSRIVNTSSMAHRLTPGIDFDDLNFSRKAYKDMDAYGKSKLATLMFTFELDRKLRQSGSNVIATVAHPGYTATNPDYGNFFMRLMTKMMAQAPAMGALPALYAATAADVSGGDFIGPGGFKELSGYPKKVDCRPEARDPKLTAKLWSLSEQLTDFKYQL
ncbi:oxidoreductase [Stenotrophobium rhamnosiphilum]|uniref:Short-chain dehydrogenase n=1 Tax=Stenotrophobium rhamnosiphilum TaxID=2029166 RepID=A0A2T5MK38_9GAMM|nr:oxidoreductase [Stenotrophobium rhamnosiphilum]PTU32943.1 short-chain dehydrogenase [Stenotrophobium rhamnosiphilum]